MVLAWRRDNPAPLLRLLVDVVRAETPEGRGPPRPSAAAPAPFRRGVVDDARDAPGIRSGSPAGGVRALLREGTLRDRLVAANLYRQHLVEIRP